MLKENKNLNCKYYYFRQRVGIGIGTAIFKDGNAVSLHNVMFIPTLVGQGTAEQCSHWLGRATKNEILGTYAQVSFLKKAALHLTLI